MSKRAKRKFAARQSGGSRDESPSEDAPADVVSSESRVSLAVTVLWMMTTLATLLTEIGILATAAVLAWVPLEEAANDNGRLLFLVLYQSSIITGSLALVLTWAVYRWRDTPPPRSVTTAVLFIAAVPLLSLVVSWIAYLLK